MTQKLLIKIISNDIVKFCTSLLTFLFAIINCTPDYPTYDPVAQDTTSAMGVTYLTPYQIITGNEFLKIQVKGNFPQYPQSGRLKIYKHTKGGSYLAYNGAVTFSNNTPFYVNLIPNANFAYTGEDYYYVGLTSDNILWAPSRWMSFVWGSPTLDIITANVGLYHMLSTNNNYYNAAISSVDSTFYYPARVGVNINFSSNNTVEDNNFVNATNFPKLKTALDEYTTSHQIGNDTFHLYFALNNSIPISVGYLVGASYSWYSANDPLNYSYIFMTTLWNYDILKGYNHYSSINEDTDHELLHQLGDLWNIEHESHGGALSNYCVLHNMSHLHNILIDTTRKYWWDICDKHIFQLRGNLLQYSSDFLSGASSNFLSIAQSNQISDKYSISMFLSKEEYKEYEPVYAKFELINLNKEPLEIYSLFEADLNVANFRIEDNIGNVWDSSKLSFSVDIGYVKPSNVILPGDTLIISMAINSWGVKISKVPFADEVFGGWAYFPAGRKYKAYFYKDGIRSNVVEFEVISLNDEDKLFLQAYQEIDKNNTPNNNIVRDYPDNTLAEYLTVANLFIKYVQIIWGDLDKYPNLVADYDIFFKKYPHTFYIYNDKFMAPYIIKQFLDLENFSNMLSEIKNKNTTDELNTYFSQRNITTRINSILGYFKGNNEKK